MRFSRNPEPFQDHLETRPASIPSDSAASKDSIPFPVPLPFSLPSPIPPRTLQANSRFPAGIPNSGFPSPIPAGIGCGSRKRTLNKIPHSQVFSPPGNPDSTPALQSWGIQVLPPAKPSFPGVPGSSGWIWDEWIRPRTGVNPSLPTPGEAPEPVRPLPGIWATLGFGISGDTQELWDAAPSAQREGLEFRGDQSMDFFLSSLSHKSSSPFIRARHLPGAWERVENGISGRKMGFLEFWGHKSMDPSQILVSTRSPDGTLEFWGGINNLG